MVRPSWVRLVAVTVALVLIAGAAMAQRRFFGRQRGRDIEVENHDYDGRFTFVRVKYATAPGGLLVPGAAIVGARLPDVGRQPHADHERDDLPRRADRRLSTCSRWTIRRSPSTRSSYLTEAGWWTMTDREVQAFRAYLLKGGFVVFDDFKLPGEFGSGGGGWDTFEENMKRVLPAAQVRRSRSLASDLPLVLRDQLAPRIFRRRTTPAGRSSADSSRTTIPTSA